MVTAIDFFFELFSGKIKQNSLDTNQQLCKFLDLSISCLSNAQETAAAGYCPQIWKFDLCWPSVPFGSTPKLNCSNSDSNLVALHCNSTTGTWNGNTEQSDCYAALKQNFSPPSQDLATPDPVLNWTTANYSMHDADYDDYEMPSDKDEFVSESTIDSFRVLQSCVTAGYSISVVSLVLALLLLLGFKRLHCTRVYIHMNLMIAFVIRGITWLFHNSAFQVSNSVEDDLDIASRFLSFKVFGLYNSSDLDQLQTWKKEFCDPFSVKRGYIWCRLYYVTSNYAVTASYYWLLVEGIYLSLILRAMNPNNLQKSKMKWFMFLGWVLPWVSIIANVLVKLFDVTENKSCWYEEKSQYYWLIIKIPILISVLINFVIFVLVVRVVGTKLKMRTVLSTGSENENFEWKLAKSTLALIPLLGIQYIVTVFFGFAQSDNNAFLFFKSSFELIFTSVQGFLVALLYCFLNNDIQEEVKREWRRVKTNWELDVKNRKKQSNTQATSLMNLNSFSVLRKQSAKTKRHDSVYTNGRSSAENSPRRSRFSTALTETTRLSPFVSRKVIVSQSTTPTAPLLDDIKMKETCLLSGANGDLSSPNESTLTNFQTTSQNNDKI